MSDEEQMVRDMCAAIDAGDAERFGAWFTEDATYRFGNGDIIRGRAAVIAATIAAAGSLPWVQHTVEQVAQVGNQLFCRFTITTAASSGAAVAMPCVTVIETAGNTVVDYRVHMDLAPVLST